MERSLPLKNEIIERSGNNHIFLEDLKEYGIKVNSLQINGATMSKETIRKMTLKINAYMGKYTVKPIVIFPVNIIQNKHGFIILLQ